MRCKRSKTCPRKFAERNGRRRRRRLSVASFSRREEKILVQASSTKQVLPCCTLLYAKKPSSTNRIGTITRATTCHRALFVTCCVVLCLRIRNSTVSTRRRHGTSRSKCLHTRTRAKLCLSYILQFMNRSHLNLSIVQCTYITSLIYST